MPIKDNRKTAGNLKPTNKGQSIEAKAGSFMGLSPALLSILLIITVTFIAFLPTLRNGYVQWDDPEYILHNPMFNAPLKSIFFGQSSFYMWNYHPLTILIYSMEYKFFGTGMKGYHAVSLVLHLANSVLVFSFIYYLLDKINITIPLITALLFGIHPMHVESVAWASELKDVLYTFFFFAALIYYVLYVQSGMNMKYIAYAFVLFLLSLVSKGQAVTLPLSFLLVDYFLKRKFDIKIATDKMLFFILSLVFGIIAIKAQDNAITINNNSQVLQNFCFGFYGLCLYIVKFILPINLSGLYPYPLNPDRSMPFIVYAAPVIIAGLLFLIFRLFRQNRVVVFGVLFFLANIFTVLKFIPVSEAIIADRYSYIPYTGLFFIMGYLFNNLLNDPAYKLNKKSVQFAGIAIIVLLSSLTWARTMVWKDSFSFWGDAIEKNSNYWHPYECLGEAYIEKSNYDSAMKYFSEGVEKDVHNLDSRHSGRLNLGLCYYKKGMFDEALKTDNELIAIAPGESTAYFQRGQVYQYNPHPQPALALADYNQAISINPNYTDAYLNRGSLYLYQVGNYDAAIADYNKTLKFNPNDINAIVNKGTAYYRKGDFDEALNNYRAGLTLAGDNSNIYYFMALAFAGKKDYSNALQYAEHAQNKGLNIDSGLLQEWKSKL